MDQSLNNKKTLKEKLILLLKNNRIKIGVLIFTIFVLIGTNYAIKISNKKENIFLSEKFIKSSILLTEGKNELAADYYEEQVDNAVDNLTSMIEPAIMIFLGVVIGGLIIAMYLPIFEMGDAIR